MTVPGRSVVLALRHAMSEGTSKIMSFVFQSCTASPLSRVRMPSAFGLGIASAVTKQGRTELLDYIETILATGLEDEE